VSGAVAAQPFDAVAPRYDATFGKHHLGRWLRAATRDQLADAFAAGQRVLELGCGTGEDAIWLARRGVRVVATDRSPAMLAITRDKVKRGGLSEQVAVEQLDLDAPAVGRWDASSFDGAFSNFGPLNCLPDRRPLAAALAAWVRPGGRVVLVVMGPCCPWELAWHLAHGDVRTAVRRWRSGALAHAGAGSTVRVWYPSPARVRAELGSSFRPLATVGIGALLPPTELSRMVERWSGAFQRLAAAERRWGRTFPWTWLNDHYAAVFERR
jgi:SAM-dependent methyltransferase